MIRSPLPIPALCAGYREHRQHAQAPTILLDRPDALELALDRLPEALGLAGEM